MGPVATKLARELRKADLGNVRDLATMREAKELSAAIEATPDVGGLPPNHAAWMAVFKVIAPLAYMLLGTHALRKLAQRVDAADEEYMPGGPPQSPLLDSVFMSWWMADLPVGPTRESLCSIIADLAPILRMPPELVRCVRLLGQSRMGVYRVSPLDRDRVQLDEVLTEERVCTRVPEDLRHRGDLWLTRLLPPIVADDADWVVWTTPYLLAGRDEHAQWSEYCERAVAGAPAAERKQRLARHFKAADDPRRWTEYIMNGYAGVMEADGAIVLAGVPDLPQTLPHHPDYDPAAEANLGEEASALHRLRIRLYKVADDLGFPRLDLDAIAQSARFHPELHRAMAIASRIYGQLDRDGRSAVDLLQRDAAALPDDEQRELAAIAAGWFSAFEILHIRTDEGMEVRDKLSRRTLWISERAATRQVEIGDLLAGWVMVEGERLTLEGAICHVPARFGDAFIAALRARRNQLGRKHRALSTAKRNGLLAQGIAALIEEIVDAAPPPTVVNNDGEDILFSSARYDVLDIDRVRHALVAHFDVCADGSYDYSVRGISFAHLELDDRVLRIECNSKERLAKTKAKLVKLLGKTVEHRADTYEDPRIGQRGPRTEAAARPAPVLPPETRAQIQAMMLGHMRSWIDQPVSMLGGKTPRQAARTDRGREAVTHMLIRQQQIFESQPSLPPIDLREIWNELGIQPRA